MVDDGKESKGEATVALEVTVDASLAEVAQATAEGSDNTTTPPGVCVGVLRSEGGVSILRIASAGERQAGSGNPCTTDDIWHMGSCTKAMTATLAAVLIESGAVAGYDVTVGQAKAQSGAGFDSSFDDVTLEQLLCHAGGVPAAGDAWNLAWSLDCYTEAGPTTPMTNQRAQYLSAVLAQGCTGAGAYSYSNEGYTLAAYMLEIFCGQPYEALLQAQIFDPLGMTTAGFGASGAPDPPRKSGFAISDAQAAAFPWGHGSQSNWEPKDPRQRGADNPMAITPAGRVHCSMQDWARFIVVHINREAASSLLGLSSQTFDAMHRKHEAGDYCRGGFIPCKKGWQKGDLCITHMGSNTSNMCSVWATEGCASMVCTNHGNCASAIDSAHVALIGMFGSRS